MDFPREKRRFPRVKTDIIVLGERKGQRFEGIIGDICRGGFCMDLAEPVLKGENLDVEIYQPLGKNAFINIEAKVRVIWNDGSDPAEEANNFRAGLKFLNMEREDLKLIDAFVKNNQ